MTDAFESQYRLVFFSCVLALLVLERVGGLQRRPVSIGTRWTSNIGLLVIGGAVSALVVPPGAYAFALQQPPGAMSRIGVPFAVQLVLTFLLLDFWKYWEHRLFHRLPLLWRAHLVHHSDTELDVTTSERHHPVEILLGIGVLIALVWALGLPAAALGAYLLAATVVALCSHANVRLPAFIDRPLHHIIVTPSVHAVHHSDARAETDSNYGAVLAIWDRLFGTFVDPARARIPHFGLDYFHRREDTRLPRVLLQPFLFRRGMEYPARYDAPIESAPGARTTASRVPLARSSRTVLIAGAIGALLVMAVMWPAMLQMAEVWRSHEAYQYAWLVLPMLIYVLGWHGDARTVLFDPRPGFLGVPVVVAAAVCWSAAALMNLDVGGQLALVLALHGIALSTLGWRAYRRLFAALALMFLMVPSADVLQPALRALTVKSIELFVSLAHLPHGIDGFVVFVGTHRYVVVDECSGLSYVTLAAFLGYCFGLLLDRSFPKVAGLSLFGAFIGLLSNVLRVNAIVLIDWMRDSQMDLTAHGTLQWLMLVVVLGVLFYVLSRSRLVAVRAVDAVAFPSRLPRLRPLAPVVAGLSAVLIAGGVAGLPSGTDPPMPALQSVALPAELAGWTLAGPASAPVVAQARVESIRVAYRREGRSLDVAVIQALADDVKLPESGLAPGDRSVWREQGIGHEVGCAGFDCVTLAHATWLRDRTDAQRHAYFAYSIGEFVTDSKLSARWAQGWHRLIGDPRSPRLVAFMADTRMDVDELAAAFRTLEAALREHDVLARGHID